LGRSGRFQIPENFQSTGLLADLKEAVERSGIASGEALDAIHEYANHLLSRHGDLSEIPGWYRRVCEARIRRGYRWEEIADARYWFGFSLKKAARIEDANECFRKAFRDLQKAALPLNHDGCWCGFLLANELTELEDQIGEAEWCYQTALRGWECSSIRCELQIARVCYALGTHYCSWRRWYLKVRRSIECDPEPLLQRAVVGLSKRLGGWHEETISAKACLGGYIDSPELLKEVFEYHKGMLGEKHPRTLRSEWTLAGALKDKVRKAEVARRARCQLGEYHPFYVDCIVSLALDECRSDPSRVHVLRSVARAYGEYNAETLKVMMRFAKAITFCDHTRADELFRDALFGYERVYGIHAENTRQAAYEYVNFLTEYIGVTPGEMPATNQRIKGIIERYSVVWPAVSRA